MVVNEYRLVRHTFFSVNRGTFFSFAMRRVLEEELGLGSLMTVVVSKFLGLGGSIVYGIKSFRPSVRQLSFKCWSPCIVPGRE